MTSNEPVDLRSDTVTRPDREMRRAMADAEVGDDVLGEDPTVRRLEEVAAEVVGKEAALFVPSGTMGNEIALHLLARPGTEVICEASSHVFNYEMGGMAALSGLLPRPLAGDRGILTPEAPSAPSRCSARPLPLPGVTGCPCTSTAPVFSMRPLR
jgi:threonine aldolase